MILRCILHIIFLFFKTFLSMHIFMVYAPPNHEIQSTTKYYYSRVLLPYLRHFAILCFQALVYYLAFQSFDFKNTWWRLFKKCVVRAKFDIYVFIEEEVISMILNPRVLKWQQSSYHLNDRIISLRGEVWAQKTSLALPLFT